MDQPVLSTIGLGCAKNLVDTERILGALVEPGWLVADEPQDADAALTNTCGFIGEAREESSGAIEYFLGLKEAGVIRAVVVIGCMVQLMRDKLPVQFPGVDACDRVPAAEGGAAPYTPDPAERPLDEYTPRDQPDRARAWERYRDLRGCGGPRPWRGLASRREAGYNADEE